MTRGAMRIAGIVAAAALLACGQAPAQRQHGTTHLIETDHSGRLEIRMRGEAELAADGRSLAGLSPDGWLRIDESRRGQPDRRVEFRPGGAGSVEVLFFREGQRRAPDAADRAWIEGVLLRAVRDSGMGAERRVARIRAAEGTDGVLREIERIGSDAGRRRHYGALLATPGLSGGEAVRVVRHAGRHLDSDAEKRIALSTALQKRSPGAGELAAILEAAGTIGSDAERAHLLARVAREQALDDARVRAAFFRAARGIRSDAELARVLMTLLRHQGARAEVVSASVGAAGEIDSDGEMARVLLAVLRHPQARADAVAAAVRASAAIGSDGERARVLVAVPHEAMRSPAVRAAVRDAVTGIRSSAERERVERRLARSRP